MSTEENQFETVIVDATDMHLEAIEKLNQQLSDLDRLIFCAILDKEVDVKSYDKDELLLAFDQYIAIDSVVADYSHAGMGRFYASWHHLRRVRTAFNALFLASGTGSDINSNLKVKLTNQLPLHIVDLGCGTGATAWALTFLGWNVDQYTGIDGSEPMLEWAKILWDYDSDWSKLAPDYDELPPGYPPETFKILKENLPIPRLVAKELRNEGNSSHFHPEWRLNTLTDVLTNGFNVDSCDILIMPHLIDEHICKTIHDNNQKFLKVINDCDPSVIIMTTTYRKKSQLAGILNYLRQLKNYNVEVKEIDFPHEYLPWGEASPTPRQEGADVVLVVPPPEGAPKDIPFPILSPAKKDPRYVSVCNWSLFCTLARALWMQKLCFDLPQKPVQDGDEQRFGFPVSGFYLICERIQA